MAMSAWGLLAAPLLMQAQPSDPNEALALELLGEGVAILETSLEGDLFGSLETLDAATMSASSGGENTAVDIGAIGVNVSEQVGRVSETTTNNTVTGGISGNAVTDNGGITTVFNNTGNGVIFQSTVNVNIFFEPPPTP